MRKSQKDIEAQAERVIEIERYSHRSAILAVVLMTAEERINEITDIKCM